MFNIIWKSAQSVDAINYDKVHKSLNSLNGDQMFIKAKIAFKGRDITVEDKCTAEYPCRYIISQPDITEVTERFKKISDSTFVATQPLLNGDCMLFDRYGFELSGYADCFNFVPNLLTDNHDAVIQAVTGDMSDLEFEYELENIFPDYDAENDDHEFKNGLVWVVRAIRFNDYIGPHGRNTAMLEYLTETIDEPGQPGCISGWNKIQQKLNENR